MKILIATLLVELQQVNDEALARRMMKSGMVKLNGKPMSDIDSPRLIRAGDCVSLGRKQSVEITEGDIEKLRGKIKQPEEAT